MGCDIHLYIEKLKKKKWVKLNDMPYDFRCYVTFAILADVRNEYGCKRIEPISKPKGVPKNASKEYKKIVKDWGNDGHSHSYLTLKELKSYDWSKIYILNNEIEEFTSIIFPILKELSEDDKGNDVRIVFFFDN